MFPCDLLRVWCFQCHFHQSLLTFRPKEHFKKKKESICLFRDLEDVGSLTLRDHPLHLRCWMVPSSPPCGRVPTRYRQCPHQSHWAWAGQTWVKSHQRASLTILESVSEFEKLVQRAKYRLPAPHPLDDKAPRLPTWAMHLSILMGNWNQRSPVLV